MNNQIQSGTQKSVDENLELLIVMLESNDGLIRQKARESLEVIGKPAVSSLSRVLRNSEITQLRWEAAKILGAIDDKRAIPSLIKALEDNDHDVAWLAAEALGKYGKLAWPSLLRMLIKRGSDSVLLRDGAHHVLLNQKEEGFNELLASLLEALESVTVRESIPIAAYNILEQLRIKKTVNNDLLLQSEKDKVYKQKIRKILQHPVQLS